MILQRFAFDHASRRLHDRLANAVNNLQVQQPKQSQSAAHHRECSRCIEHRRCCTSRSKHRTSLGSKAWFLSEAWSIEATRLEPGFGCEDASWKQQHGIRRCCRSIRYKLLPRSALAEQNILHLQYPSVLCANRSPRARSSYYLGYCQHSLLLVLLLLLLLVFIASCLLMKLILLVIVSKEMTTHCVLVALLALHLPAAVKQGVARRTEHEPK